jgi:hypothetical protein
MRTNLNIRSKPVAGIAWDLDAALNKRPIPPKRRALEIPGNLPEPAVRTALSPQVQASIDAQRAEVQRRAGIVNEYRELLASARPGRGVRRSVVAAAAIRRRYRIGLRTIERYGAWLAGMKPDVRTVLMTTGPLTIHDLPLRCVRVAETRFQILRAWRTAVQTAKGAGVHSGRVTAGFLRRRPGLSQGTLYRWDKAFRDHGPGGLLDGRAVRWLKVKAGG